MAWPRTSIATFRGVPFHVDVGERSTGRRTVTHEFPRRDKPFVEDMGRQSRTFLVEGYVLGERYHLERDALIAALEEPGPGELVHPYVGTRRVICASVRVRESKGDGGMARFSIDFAETEDRSPAPTAQPNAGDRVRASVAIARARVNAEFQANYSATSLVNSAANMLRSATLAVNNARSTIGRAVQQVATMQRRVEELLGAVDALVRSPENLIAQFGALAGGLTRREAMAAYAFDPGPRPPSTTSSRAIEAANYDALGAFLQRTTMLRAAEDAPAGAYSSQEEALEARDAILEVLDEQAETAGPELYEALAQLRADLVRALPPVDSKLPRLMETVPSTTLPSLVLAHRLYGSVSLELDLVARNRIPHPGFLHAGEPLEVRVG